MLLSFVIFLSLYVKFYKVLIPLLVYRFHLPGGLMTSKTMSVFVAVRKSSRHLLAELLLLAEGDTHSDSTQLNCNQKVAQSDICLEQFKLM